MQKVVPITMDNVNDPTSRDDKGLALSFENLNYKIGERVLVDNVSGVFQPGRLTAVMGPSGAGKTTFLSIICDRLQKPKNAVLEGKMFINNEVYNRKWRKCLALVPQEDIIYETAKVKEAVQFSCVVKSKKLEKGARGRRVSETIHSLHLDRCKDSVVGSELERGISGGEKKRTGIAVELISKPRIFILDEPTSGLDSQNALNVVESLKFLARSGCTVVTTLHQPSSQIVECIDDIILLAKGKVAYHGPISEMLTFFTACGFDCPRNYNPMDFVLKVMSNPDTLDRVLSDWSTAYPNRICDPVLCNCLCTPTMKQRTGYGIEFRPASETHQELDEYIVNTTSSYAAQFIECYKRSSTNYLRNKSLATVRTGSSIFFGLIVGFLYYKVGNGQLSINDRLGLMFVSIVNNGMLALSSGLTTFPPERKIFINEQASKSYHPAAYVLALFLSEFPFQLAIPVLYCIPVYYLCGLAEGQFWVFAVLNVLRANCMHAYSTIVSTFVKTVENAMVLAPIIMMPLMLVTGLMASADRIRPTLIWLEHISPFRYALVGALKNEYEHMGPITCNQGQICAWKSGQQVVEFMKFDMNYSVCMIVLAALFIAARVFSMTSLSLIAKRQFG